MIIDPEPKSYVIVSNRRWNDSMATNLHRRTGQTYHEISARDQFTPKLLAELAPQYVFIPHWSHIVPPEIHETYTCIIFHMTDLPFGRGGSPLQNLISSGITDTIITALKCERDLDAGPVYLKRPLNLNGNAEEIYLRASRTIEDMILEIVQTEPQPQPQVGEPTYFKRRSPEQSDMRNADTLDGLYDMIRMLDAEGYPHAFLDVGPFRLEFTRACRRTTSVEANVRIMLKEKETE